MTSLVTTLPISVPGMAWEVGVRGTFAGSLPSARIRGKTFSLLIKVGRFCLQILYVAAIVLIPWTTAN